MKNACAIFLGLVLFVFHTNASNPPSFEKVLEILIKNNSLVFRAGDHQHLDCKSGETLGVYLARLIANGSSGSKHSLKMSCGSFDSKKSPLPPPSQISKVWECTLSAHQEDEGGESPWQYDLVFRLDRKNNKLDKLKMACPGSP